MNRLIKVIRKEPGERVGRITYIPNTLEDLQRAVGGYIEVLGISDTTVLICNEEGKIKGLPPNIRVGYTRQDVVVGTVIIAGAGGDEFCDVPFDLNRWKLYLKSWGN